MVDRITLEEPRTIATLGSHSSLQILKGAKDEGFDTLLICEEKRLGLYRRFKFIDEILTIKQHKEALDKRCQQHLQDVKSIIVPHGTMIAYFTYSEIEDISIPIFGNRKILQWESDRILKQKLMSASRLTTPKLIQSKDDIDELCIVKLHGAAGGRGYFLAWDKKSFEENAESLLNQRRIKGEDELFIQEYVVGVPTYLQFFYSPVNKQVEFLGADIRYESIIDSIGRIPARQQLSVNLEPSYNVIGNIPLVLRESLLEEVYNMGERFVKASEELVPPGMTGPFCLEGVYDREGAFTAFEFSARIVAGTNLYINGSPYSELLYEKPMSMGRRIAHEIKIANEKGHLDRVFT
ncbi:MAG TPA: formate--phosphoribosylaminoimidazolecarboxamide ligase [Nitrososphaeraceae archaeon]|nr:formate--phosphoribosylaminoimidazolecarboxamide ligase [Nitrososphaeraceae archaeon]